MLRRKPLVALVALLALLVTQFVGLSPAKADPLISDQESITKAADWIKDQWDDGKYGTSDAGLLADGIMALSSAGMHKDTIDEMVEGLRKVGPAYTSPSRADALAKVILTADIAGISDPAHFYGPDRDLVAELITAVNNKKLNQAWGGYLAVIALARLDRLGDLDEAGMNYLMSRMIVTPDGGFGWSATGKGDPDFTGIGLSAMLLLKDHSEDPAIVSQASTKLNNAIQWSETSANRRVDLNGNYYWIAVFGNTDGASSNSTGMIASALNEAGVNIESPKAAMKYEQSMTASGAAWSNTYAGQKDDLRATVQAIFAITGTGYATAEYAPRAPWEPLSLSIEDAPTTATVGEDARARIKVAGSSVDNVKVTIEFLVNGSWTATESGTTNASGIVTIPLTYGSTTPGTYKYRAVAAGTTTPTYTLTRTAASSLTLQSAPPTAKVGATANATLKLTPAAAGQQVTIQFLVNGSWSTSRSATTNASGIVTIPLTYGSTTPGTYKYRAVAAGTTTPTYTLTRTR